MTERFPYAPIRDCWTATCQFEVRKQVLTRPDARPARARAGPRSGEIPIHTTVDDFAAAQAATFHQAQGLARTIADTLTAMYPTAAYLALERDGNDRDHLWLHSIRDITGHILWDTASSSPLPALADAELRQAWGQMDPCVPSNLGGLINSLAAVGALFDFLPDSAAHEDDPKDPDPDLLCLPLSDQAEPGLWWWDGDALLRPYSAPRPATPHN